jgi:hypothetical protein
VNEASTPGNEVFPPVNEAFTPVDEAFPPGTAAFPSVSKGFVFMCSPPVGGSRRLFEVVRRCGNLEKPATHAILTDMDGGVCTGIIKRCV